MIIIKFSKELETATGRIHFGLSNDAVFHMVMHRSDRVLKNLISSLLGIEEENIKYVELLNPIDYGKHIHDKQIVLDVKLCLNNDEILNIEVQFYDDVNWIARSVYYLCKSYCNIKDGEDYDDIKPTTQVCITNQNLFPEHPEFFAKYALMNEKTYHKYTTNFNMYVLNCNHINLATDEDRKRKLDYWARMFVATDWEELKQIAREDECYREVTEIMYSVNVQPEEQTIAEAREKYRMILSSNCKVARREGYKEAEAEYQLIIKNKDNELQEKENALKDKDARIAELEALLESKM